MLNLIKRIKLLGIGMLICLSGCAARYRINVDSYADYSRGGIFPCGSSFYIVENPDIEPNPMLRKEVSSKIARLLTNRGYKMASVLDADYYFLYCFGIGKGQDIVYPLPLYTPGGKAAAKTWGSSGWSRTDIELPGSTTCFPMNISQYDRWLYISVIDGKQFREIGDIQYLYECRTTSSGRSGDLREVINYLLIATFDYFGKNTSKMLKINLYEGDRRVQEIK